MLKPVIFHNKILSFINLCSNKIPLCNDWSEGKIIASLFVNSFCSSVDFFHKVPITKDEIPVFHRQELKNQTRRQPYFKISSEEVATVNMEQKACESASEDLLSSSGITSNGGMYPLVNQ